MHVSTNIIIDYRANYKSGYFFHVVIRRELTPGGFMLQYEKFITPSKGIFTQRGTYSIISLTIN